MNLSNDIFSIEDREIYEIFNSIKIWRLNLYCSNKIDKILIKEELEKAYNILSTETPDIVFTRGLKEVCFLLKSYYSFIISCEEYFQLRMNLSHLIFNIVSKKIIYAQKSTIINILAKESKIFEYTCYGLHDYIYDFFDSFTPKLIDLDSDSVNNCYIQYCIENFKLSYNTQAWKTLKILNQECPYLIPLSKLCIVIERPIEVHLDNEQLPHAQNKPAMLFGDESKVYYHHGIPFPHKYGEILINDWKPEWILSEEIDEYKSILIYTIGYKRFLHEFPNYDFWQDSARLLRESSDIIINWQLYHHNQLYLKHPQTDDLKINPADAVKIIDTLPFKLPTELSNLYHYYNGGYQLTPGLHFYPLKQAIQALPNLTWIKSDTGYPFPLFKGTRDEIYYVLADDPEPTYCHVYCQFPDAEPVIYAECVTSLIVTIAQCYQEGAYYIAINEETGERSIEQDLDKIEPIFEKFNPDQIDNWRKIWKS